jgi:hypothetical protein
MFNAERNGLIAFADFGSGLGEVASQKDSAKFANETKE